ncbi:MAG: TIM barrel protein [Acidobacteria bacterium]|nr:TIM barrel protein [Acidobacteriota bacterium]
MIARRVILSYAGLAPLLAADLVPRSRVSFITDEVAKSPQEAIAFARRFGLTIVELRQVPGTRRGYWDLIEAEQTEALRELADIGLFISFIDSGLLACPIPGTTPLRQPGPKEAERFTNRMEELRRVVDFAQRAQASKIRCFTFRRVADPGKLFTQIADLILPMAEYAAKQGVQLLVENESSCNMNTCSEIAGLMKLLPASALLNWDPGNASNQERAFPDGYKLLPVSRIANVQLKGKSLLGDGDGTDWPGLVKALVADGYRGHFALETHTRDRVADSVPAMERLLGIVAG